jgi:hypothetical protein
MLLTFGQYFKILTNQRTGMILAKTIAFRFIVKLFAS